MRNWMPAIIFMSTTAAIFAGELPFSNLIAKPPINPYTYLGPQSTPLDLQQMTYMRDKYEVKDGAKNRPAGHYVPYEPPKGTGIRPTGHKTHFMNLPF